MVRVLGKELPLLCARATFDVSCCFLRDSKGLSVLCTGG